MTDSVSRVLSAVGPRLRAIRLQRDLTLNELAAQTGISVSTLSRLESGQRKPTLELLLPLAEAYEMPLDEIAGATRPGDPRVLQQPYIREGITFIPLSREPRGMQAFRMIIPGQDSMEKLPEQRTHTGYDWIYVLEGRLRLLLGEHDLVLGPGEAAEFDTRVPHAFYSAGNEVVEVLGLFGEQGERVHVRARSSERRGKSAG